MTTTFRTKFERIPLEILASFGAWRTSWKPHGILAAHIITISTVLVWYGLPGGSSPAPLAAIGTCP